jgi:hypothetical protein
MVKEEETVVETTEGAKGVIRKLSTCFNFGWRNLIFREGRRSTHDPYTVFPR